MDPQATLRMLVNSLRSGLDKDALEHAANLLDWIGRKGVVPVWPGPVEMPGWLPRSSALAILIQAINKHLPPQSQPVDKC